MKHMNEQLPLPPQPQKSSYKPILISLLFSFLLAGGTCFGFLSTFNVNKNSKISEFYAACFVFCVLDFLGSLLWLVIKAVRDGFRGG